MSILRPMYKETFHNELATLLEKLCFMFSLYLSKLLGYRIFLHEGN
jgi:hypothetical protein